jgi:hypothetical protein
MPAGINWPVLDAAMAHIRAHPERHSQYAWRCETSMCLAGWVCELAGGQWAYPANSSESAVLLAAPEDETFWIFTDDGRDVIHAENRAARLLGCSDRTADGLFREAATLPELEQTVEMLRTAVTS